MRRLFVLCLCFSALLPVTASAALYTKFALSPNDERDYRKIAATIPSCADTDRSIPDVEHIHVTARGDVDRMLHAVRLDVACRVDLKRRNASRTILRMTDYRRSMTCLALNIADPDDERANAPCNSPSAL